MTDSEGRRREALNRALEAFPELRERVDSPDDGLLAIPYFVYGLLAGEISERWRDESFWARACKFMDRLAESGDDVFEELLVVGLLESVAEDPTLAEYARKSLGAKAVAFLRRVESELFGRE
jgi:hypothetical protein